MTKEEYHKYLKSRDWLLKKNELISTYLKQGWDIDCKVCGSTDNLNVHHERYDNIGNEIVTDERIWDLSFMCYECHQKWHFEKGFKEEFEKKSFEKGFIDEYIAEIDNQELKWKNILKSIKETDIFILTIEVECFKDFELNGKEYVDIINLLKQNKRETVFIERLGKFIDLENLVCTKRKESKEPRIFGEDIKI
jgi:hypothetical protein